MISGEMDEGDAVVRVKTSLDIPNPALRLASIKDST